MSSLTRKFQQKDSELLDRLAFTPFHPGYWCRRRVDQAVVFAAKYATGRLLDVGCGAKPYRADFAQYVDSHTGIEYSDETVFRTSAADVFGDAMNLPFADGSFSTVLCTEVLEHLPDPELAVREFSRVLAPGGVVITTAPFFYPIHDKLDFFRYSPDGVASMMKREGLEIELIKPLSGTAVTIALMFNLYWFELGFMWTKWLYPFGVILRPVLLLLSLLVNLTGAVFELLLPSNHMAFNHLTIARKPSEK